MTPPHPQSGSSYGIVLCERLGTPTPCLAETSISCYYWPYFWESGAAFPMENDGTCVSEPLIKDKDWSSVITMTWMFSSGLPHWWCLTKQSPNTPESRHAHLMEYPRVFELCSSLVILSQFFGSFWNVWAVLEIGALPWSSLKSLGWLLYPIP